MKTLKKGIALLVLLLFALSLYSGCQIGADDTESRTYQSSGEVWNCGFGRRQIIPDENGDGPLYIAGYKNGVEITRKVGVMPPKAFTDVLDANI